MDEERRALTALGWEDDEMDTYISYLVQQKLDSESSVGGNWARQDYNQLNCFLTIMCRALKTAHEKKVNLAQKGIRLGQSVSKQEAPFNPKKNNFSQQVEVNSRTVPSAEKTISSLPVIFSRVKPLMSGECLSNCLVFGQIIKYCN